jgi:hypothetical protein
MHVLYDAYLLYDGTTVCGSKVVAHLFFKLFEQNGSIVSTKTQIGTHG